MKRKTIARCVAGAFLYVPAAVAWAQASEPALTVSPLDADPASVSRPASVLRGDDLRRRQASSIGETLEHEPGVQSSGMGPGTSRPVIRGMDAPRVRILDNGLGSMDLSTISPDHRPMVETLGATQVEVLRGPAALLYGGGAIGGLVNVVTKRIPVDRMKGFEGAAELRIGGAERQQTGVVDLNGGTGSMSWHADAFNRHTHDYRIKGPQITNDATSPVGVVRNSAVDASGLNLGATMFGDRGSLGLGVSTLNSVYGIPGPEGARIDMRQTRYELQGELLDPMPGFSKAKVRLGRNNYAHDEIESTGDMGTLFRNRQTEGRLELTHAAVGNLRGVVGLSFYDQRFSAVGAEAVLPPTKGRGNAIFLVEEYTLGPVRFDFGARADQEKRNPDPASGQTNRSFSLGTYSGGAVWSFMPGYNTGISFTRAQRAPSIEELYSNGPHAGTGSFETGDATLRPETSRNLDWSLRKTSGEWRWKASVFSNRMKNYIFGQRQDVDGDGVFNAQLDRVDDTNGADPAGTLFRVNFRQAEARFKGFEGELRYQPERGGFGARVFGDSARGTIVGFGNVPRMSPKRIGLEGTYGAGPWGAFASVLKVYRQARIAADQETATSGYNRVDVGVNYRIKHSGASTTTLFVQGNNLLNREIRVHTSFLKEFAPQAGRSVFAGVRSIF